MIRPGHGAGVGRRKRSTQVKRSHEDRYHNNEFQDFSTQVWTLMQVKRHWKTQRHGDLWSESDKRQLRAQIRRIWGRSERVRVHTNQTPFPSLLQSTTWTETKTWYMCDRTLTEELCDLQAAVFWALGSTWSWRSTSGSNRVSHHHMEGRLFGPSSNNTALVNERGAFASRYRPPKSGIPQITRG